LGNLPLWLTLWRLPELHTTRTLLGVAGLAVVLTGVLFATLSVLVWPRWLKPAGLLLLTTATASSYFMVTYGIVIDPTMVANIASTDVREVRDLLSPAMALALLLGIVLPGLWWWRQPIGPRPLRAVLPRQAAGALLGLLVAVMVLWLTFQDRPRPSAQSQSPRCLRPTYKAGPRCGGGLASG
jgi:lipid A ethanolaminephosphotransferase